MTKLILKRATHLLLTGAISLFAISAAKAQPTVTDPTSITNPIAGGIATVNEGEVLGSLGGTQQFSITATKSKNGSLSYQWYWVKKGTTDTIAVPTGTSNKLIYARGSFGTTYDYILASKSTEGDFFCRVKETYTVNSVVNIDSINSKAFSIRVNLATESPTKYNISIGNSGVTTGATANANVIITTAGSSYISALFPGTGFIRPSSFQWYKDGMPFGGNGTTKYVVWATANPGAGVKLTLNPADLADAGTYYCLLTNSAGTTSTDTFHLSVNSSTAIPSFTTINGKAAPDSAITFLDTMFIGSKADFLTISPVTGTYTSIQWYKGTPPSGVSLGTSNGANTTIYRPSTWTAADAGIYYAILYNGAIKELTNSIQIAVVDGKGVTASVPTGKLELADGVDTLVLSAAAKGIKIIEGGYKWFRNGEEVRGQSTATYKGFYPIAISDTGLYTYQARNEVDSALSGTVRVTITREDIPMFVNLGDSYLQSLSSNVRLAVKGVTSETLTKWLIIDTKNNNTTFTPVTDAQGVLRLTNNVTPLSVGKYRVKVTNADGSLVLEKVVEIK